MQELIIHKEKEEKKIYAIVENGILLEKYEESKENARIEGNIYLGRVENVLQGMQAAFVNIGEGKNTFIHLKDLLPKKDITKKDITSDEKIEDIPIKTIVKPGHTILVQVKRDSTNKKGARISTHISLNSKYFIFMPQTDIITISQKIEEAKEKNRLLAIVKEILPSGYGAIIRTASMGQAKEELTQDLKSVIARWEKIEKLAKQKQDQVPILLEENNNLLERLLFDTIGKEGNQILVDDRKIYEETKETLHKLSFEKVMINLKQEDELLSQYDLKKQLEKAENRKIWLKCGGFITIDKTEALTAIDVNSGKYTGAKSLEQTVLKVNKEATEEIAKQIRLRDIGGIIIIDYIDMQEEEHEKEIEKLLTEKLKKDRSKTQVFGFTKLNLLEMTRKHMFSND